MTCKYIDPKKKGESFSAQNWCNERGFSSPQRQRIMKTKGTLLTIMFQVPRIRNNRQPPSASRRDSDHLGSKLRATWARQRDRESIMFRKRLDLSRGYIVAHSAAAGMREGRFGAARRRPTVTRMLFGDSGTPRRWPSSKIHLWAWFHAPGWAQTLRLLTFYPCG